VALTAGGFLAGFYGYSSGQLDATGEQGNAGLSRWKTVTFQW
jgi:hypothetical protein